MRIDELRRRGDQRDRARRKIEHLCGPAVAEQVVLGMRVGQGLVRAARRVGHVADPVAVAVVARVVAPVVPATSFIPDDAGERYPSIDTHRFEVVGEIVACDRGPRRRGLCRDGGAVCPQIGCRG